MTRWRKSSRSSGVEENSCIEVAPTGRAIAVRDSKDPDGPRLHFGVPAWDAFIGTIKTDGFPPARHRT